MDKNLIQRTISGIVYVAIIILCSTPLGAQLINSIAPGLIKQQYLYHALMSLLLVVGTWECVKIMKFGKGYEKWVVYPLVIFIFYIFSKRYFNHDFFFDFRLSEIFTVIYVALPFSFALGLPKFSSYNDTFSLEVLFLFILIWSSDTFAYLVGKFFGKHKMAPKISPKKTWEGYIGGVVLTLVLSYFIEHYQPELRGNWMFVGFLVAAFAPLGDLVESQLKRNFGVKDSGNIIPGHGGVLDRLDSFIICVPVVYLYFILEKFI